MKVSKWDPTKQGKQPLQSDLTASRQRWNANFSDFYAESPAQRILRWKKMEVSSEYHEWKHNLWQSANIDSYRWSELEPHVRRSGETPSTKKKLHDNVQRTLDMFKQAKQEQNSAYILAHEWDDNLSKSWISAQSESQSHRF